MAAAGPAVSAARAFLRRRVGGGPGVHAAWPKRYKLLQGHLPRRQVTHEEFMPFSMLRRGQQGCQIQRGDFHSGLRLQLEVFDFGFWGVTWLK